MSVLEDAVEIYREALPILLVSLVGGLFAGIVLGGGGMRGVLRDVPGLLLMLPAILATRENIYGALGARISTGLHQGLIEPRLEVDERLVNAVTASIINGFIVSVFIAVSSWIILLSLGSDSAPLLNLIGISFLAVLFSGITLIILLLIFLFAGFRRGLDPDILIGPIVTTTGDLFGVIYIYISVILIRVFLG